MSTENLGVAASLDKYGEEDLFSMLVRYGLFVGAIFQFVCISAAVLMSGNESLDANEDEGRGLIDEPTPNSANARRLHKIRKLEKKKRR
ncbi:protein anon-73B1 [Drosophila nasuta]|uniref:Protein anon-73B1 n=1 Tax=Drosophila albomicans TaxID=7291 RepID=A0A6P8Y4U9_DROAB|nr:protein anon-73B1 [Drosophila albomicans]XP_060658829.1 protein anon-73B1 [Drosophila nasuta]